MNDNWSAIFLLAAVGIAVTARVLTEMLVKTKQRKMRFGSAAGLFLLYTLGLMLVLYSVCYQMSGVGFSLGDYHRRVVLSVLAWNLAVFLMGCMCYAKKGKHKLSDADKMKLLDM